MLQIVHSTFSYHFGVCGAKFCQDWPQRVRNLFACCCSKTTKEFPTLTNSSLQLCPHYTTGSQSVSHGSPVSHRNQPGKTEILTKSHHTLQHIDCIQWPGRSRELLLNRCRNHFLTLLSVHICLC